MTMRLVLLAIGAVIILAILWDGLRRKKQQNAQVDIDKVLNAGKEKPLKPKKTATPKVRFNQPSDDHFNLASAKRAVEQELEVPSESPEFIEESIETPPVEETHVEEEAPIKQSKKPDMVWFTLRAREDDNFGGFKLLQVLLANGFRFADDKLFYYHENREASGTKLFGLAAATDNGTFDLTNMARFKCKGLVLFLTPDQSSNLELALNEMLEAAESLQEDLNANLFIEQDKDWSQEGLSELRLSLDLAH